MPAHIRAMDDGTDEAAPTYRAAGLAQPRLIIERRWLNASLAFMDGIIGVFYWNLLRGHPASSGALLFPLVHVGAGLFITSRPSAAS
jgi:hypothetical protein